MRGASDIEIGQKYGVNLRYIEQLITKIKGVNVSILKATKKIRNLHPKGFIEERSTVWSFKNRGSWATHSGAYRGNWSPYIPRNIIIKYSKHGELVLDYFCGAGTTAVEAKLLGRRCVCFDINDKAIELAKDNLDFSIQPMQLSFTESTDKEYFEPDLFVGDARDLSFLHDNSIDLICAHPPYANIIHYTNNKPGDLSFLDIEEFLKEIAKVAQESFRVLKPGRQCAILIGDTRRRKHVIPLGFRLINVFLDAGFKLKELVIKRQHNCKTTGFWYSSSIKNNFLLLAHEYLPIFEKPKGPHAPAITEEISSKAQIIPFAERHLGKTKLNELETTTVWIFKENDFNESIEKNIISRYASGKRYSLFSIDTVIPGDTFNNSEAISGNQLIFVKSPILDKTFYLRGLEDYLNVLHKLIENELDKINKGGFLVVQAKDVRIDNYIEPVGKKIVELINFNELWLKEIIIVTSNMEPIDNNNSNNELLGIIHQYLIIFKKI